MYKNIIIKGLQKSRARWCLNSVKYKHRSAIEVLMLHSLSPSKLKCSPVHEAPVTMGSREGLMFEALSLLYRESISMTRTPDS